jgi:hypothetical protein
MTVEVERQLAAAAARHREMLASMQELGRPEAGQHVAVKAVDRAVRLVCFSLRRGADAGVPVERLAELTGWDESLVIVGLAKADEPEFVARLVPAGLDADIVARTAAGVKASVRLHALTDAIATDALEGGSSAPDPEALDDLHDRLDAQWREWRGAPSLTS